MQGMASNYIWTCCNFKPCTALGASSLGCKPWFSDNHGLIVWTMPQKAVYMCIKLFLKCYVILSITITVSWLWNSINDLSKPVLSSNLLLPKKFLQFAFFKSSYIMGAYFGYIAYYLATHTLAVADPEGGGKQQVHAPCKFWSTLFLKIPLCIRMLQTKVQVVWESI